MDGAEQSQTLFKKSLKPKKATKVRLNLGAAGQDDDEGVQEVFKPKKNTVIRGSITNRAPITKTERQTIYSSDYLNELRESTPTIPRDLPDDLAQSDFETHNVVDEEHDTPQIPAPTILDESTIRHVKEQREIKRRAGENYIPLQDALDVYKKDTADHGKRLQTEDTVDMHGGDGTEGLEGYESDTLPLGLRNARNADLRKREEIETLIQERQENASGASAQSSEDDSSDSDDEWERTQTQKTGTASAAPVVVVGESGRIVPPIITPLPTIQQTLEKLRLNVEAAKKLVTSKRLAIEQIEREQLEVAEREEAIKAGLQRANLTYETAQLSVGGLETITRR